MEMEHHRSQGVVVFRRQLLHQVSHHGRFRSGILHAGSRDELLMQFKRQEWIWQRPEICLKNWGDTADVIETIGVTQVEGWIVATLEQLSDLLREPGTAGFPIDSLVLKAYSAHVLGRLW